MNNLFRELRLNIAILKNTFYNYIIIIKNYIIYLKHKEEFIWDNLYSGDLDVLPWLRNPLPLDDFIKFYEMLNPSKRILDYGCGDCRISKLFYNLGANITCADISAKALLLCENNIPKENIIKTSTPFNLKKDYFDGIILWGVLHHINPSKRRKFLYGLFRTLRENGYLLIGGWSKNDIEFNNNLRISSITHTKTWPIDKNVNELTLNSKFTIQEESIFEFVEYYKNKNRKFAVFLMKKCD